MARVVVRLVEKRKETTATCWGYEFCVKVVRSSSRVESRRVEWCRVVVVVSVVSIVTGSRIKCLSHPTPSYHPFSGSIPFRSVSFPLELTHGTHMVVIAGVVLNFHLSLGHQSRSEYRNVMLDLGR